MSVVVSFVLSFFPRDVLDEILNLIESVSEDFPSYSYYALACHSIAFFFFVSLSLQAARYRLENLKHKRE